jgi:cytochrome c556
MMRMIIQIAVLIVLAMLLSAAALADDKDVIDYRQHIMNTLNEQSAALGQILSTAVPGDNAGAHIDAIALTASTALTAFQPKVQGGEAKPEVWRNWADFSKRMNEFADKTREAAKMAKEKGSDVALANILDALTCKSCHEIYRDERKK